MKRKLMILTVLVMILSSVFVWADEFKLSDGAYDVPVNMINYYDMTKKSMGDAALRKTARVEVRRGEAVYHIYTSKLKFMGFEGGLTNLFIYDKDKDGKRVEAKSKPATIKEYNLLKGEKVPFNLEFTFNRKTLAEKNINIAVWVDAMDRLKSEDENGNYTKGAGEQPAKLVFDWAKAKRVKTKDKEVIIKVLDVPTNHWSSKAVSYVMKQGYFHGDGKGHFMPNQKITKAQFVTVLGNIFKVDKTKYMTNNFADVKKTDYYYSFANWAKQKKLYHGYGDKLFQPNKVVSREEMAYMLEKYITMANIKLTVHAQPSFADFAKISDWAKPSVNKISKLGVVKGMSGKFQPKGCITRAQVAQVIYNIEKNK